MPSLHAPATLFGFMFHMTFTRHCQEHRHQQRQHQLSTRSLRMQGLQQRPPIVVAAHGIAGQKDMGLEPFAETFASKGLAVLLFDYRNFGGSEGEPRNWVSPKRHLQDWDAALDYVRVPHSCALASQLWIVSLSALPPLAIDTGPGPCSELCQGLCMLQCVPAVPPSVFLSQLDLCTYLMFCFQSRMISANV